MQVSTRLIPRKWLPLSLWIVFFTVTALAALTLRNSPRDFQSPPESASDGDDGATLASAKRFDTAAAEVSAVAKRLADAPRFRQTERLLPELPARKEQHETMQVANTLVVQSGNRLVVYLNGEPIQKGTRLPSGGVVIAVTQRAITLADPDGVRRSIPLATNLSRPSVIEKGEPK